MCSAFRRSSESLGTTLRLCRLGSGAGQQHHQVVDGARHPLPAGITDAVPLVDDHGHRGVVVAAFGFGFGLPRSEGELGGVLQLGDDAGTAEGR